jgi:hypothetical protein
VAKLAKMSYAALARIKAPFNRIIWNGAAAADELESSRSRSVCDIGPERRYGRVRSQARAEIFPASKMRGNSIVWTEHHLVLSRGLARPALQRSPVAAPGDAPHGNPAGRRAALRDGGVPSIEYKSLQRCNFLRIEDGGT